MLFVSVEFVHLMLFACLVVCYSFFFFLYSPRVLVLFVCFLVVPLVLFFICLVVSHLFIYLFIYLFIFSLLFSMVVVGLLYAFS